jgi:hypothetical protein
MMLAANTDVSDPLFLGGKLCCELPRGINLIVGAVGMDAGGCGIMLKIELGLNSLSPGEAHLVNHGKLATGSITEDGATTELLSQKGIPVCGELMIKETGLVLVQENEIPRSQLVHGEGPVLSFGNGGSCLGGVLLLSKLTGCAFGGIMVVDPILMPI